MRYLLRQMHFTVSMEVNELVREKKDELELKKKINKAFADNREKILVEYYEAKEYLEKNKELIMIINRHDHYQRRINEVINEIQDLSKDEAKNRERIDMLNKTLETYVPYLENAKEEKKLHKIDSITESMLKDAQKNFGPLHKNIEYRLANLEKTTIAEEKQKELQRKQREKDEKMLLM